MSAFVYSRQLFAGTTAHIIAMVPALLLVGVNRIPSAYVVRLVPMGVVRSALSRTLTHYPTGPSPIVVGSGFVTSLSPREPGGAWVS